MISKSRLEELIEQGARVWCICYYTYHKSKPNKKIEYYDLSSEDVCISPAEFRDYGLRIYNSLGYWNDVRYENLFETKEEAEWYREFGCIERTERLELPTWEEFDGKKFVWFFDKDHKSCCLHYLNFANQIFINVDGDVITIGDLTKENYTIACRKAKELFLGEKENV